ncbi:hypothetical protein SAMN03080601_02558 [Alkalitalea saponilacus]|uniref:Uncharacterized protein n=1 Tax=Alkalitalea saponilacus TaxID=889453 RepID=A0A1T5HNU2_9BACT|nr:hypothetical protein SAMN03080601_02558 [Alkalitalea saponilacus]
MEILILLLLFLLFDVILLIYFSKKYKTKPWHLRKILKSWNKEYGGA